MANTSGKRIAAQNESMVNTLRLGMILPTVISLVLRFLFRRSSLPPSKGSLAIYVVTFFPGFFLSKYLVKIGTPRREAYTNTLLSFGEDLSQPGVTEWCFDIVYVTWACQIGSGAFGDWFWWFYMIIPIYAVWKLWTSMIGPMFFNKGSSASSETVPDKEPAGSKRQEKLRKRQEKGDPRVRVHNGKK